MDSWNQQTAATSNQPSTGETSQNGFAEIGVASYNLTGAGAQSTPTTTPRVALPIVPVVVRSQVGEQYVETYALLDNGSTNTFCSEELLTHLNISNRPKETLSLTTLEKENSSMETTVVSLEVSDLDGKNVISMPRVYARCTLPINMNVVNQADIDRWVHLQDINFPSVSMQKVTLLIGQDIPEALIPLEVRRGNIGEPYATRTTLGWSINGPTGMAKNHNAIVNFVHADPLENQVEKFWKLEASELLTDDNTAMSVNDKRVINIWNDTICQYDGHYEMAIPFKHRPPDLPSNRSVAARRLELLGRRLVKDQSLHGKYRDDMNDLLHKGCAVKVDQDEMQDEITWYLPHHPVIKPEKVRIVFDCSARYMNTSLNDQVFKGPDLMNKLIGILLRFREHPIAIMADVESMFHQVKVSPEDCGALRFLWWPDGDMTLDPAEHKMVVHLFGGIWSPSCANFAIQRTAKDNCSDFDPETVDTVLGNFYVDDCLKSVQTELQGIKLAKQLFELLSRGGFRLTKWISNNQNVLLSIPEEERAKTVKDLDQIQDILPVERALDVRWDVDTDQFCFKCIVKDKPPTKRGVLSIVSSVYDPLGFVSPFVLCAKRILQQLCRLKLGWDDTLPQFELNQWLSWLDDLPMLEQFKVDRCFNQRFEDVDIVHSQLHNFSDASESGYGVVSYLRVIDSIGNIQCYFVTSKSRLTPLKSVTVPRLELTAATLAVKMDKMI